MLKSCDLPVFKYSVITATSRHTFSVLNICVQQLTYQCTHSLSLVATCLQTFVIWTENQRVYGRDGLWWHCIGIYTILVNTFLLLYLNMTVSSQGWPHQTLAKYLTVWSCYLIAQNPKKIILAHNNCIYHFHIQILHLQIHNTEAQCMGTVLHHNLTCSHRLGC